MWDVRLTTVSRRLTHPTRRQVAIGDTKQCWHWLNSVIIRWDKSGFVTFRINLFKVNGTTNPDGRSSRMAMIRFPELNSYKNALTDHSANTQSNSFKLFGLMSFNINSPNQGLITHYVFPNIIRYPPFLRGLCHWAMALCW